MPTLPLRPRIAPLAAALALCAPASANAAIITVNDATAGSVAGKCTLPDAVAAINGALAVNGCPAGDGNVDTISLSALPLPSTILFNTATSADGKSAIAFTRAAHLVGPLGGDGKPLVTIARNAAASTKFRVIASTAHLTLEGLAITGGDSDERGGGVAEMSPVSEYVRVINSVVTGNNSVLSGGGISIDCVNLQVEGSTVSGNSAGNNGGGIYSASKADNYPCYTTTIVQRSTVAANTAVNGGGGVFSFSGQVFVQNTTLNGNSAKVGGAVYLYDMLLMTNATVTGNYASVNGGGIYAGNGISYMLFSTVAGNNVGNAALVGGIKTGTLDVSGTIITGNVGANVTVRNPYGTYLLKGSHDVIGGAPLPNTASSVTDCDPKLGPLGNNGGEVQTMSLGSGSCAIDAGPPVVPMDGVDNIPPRTDARGNRFLRVFGAASDIGAYETQPNERVFFDGFDRDYTFAYFPQRPRVTATIGGNTPGSPPPTPAGKRKRMR